MCAACVCVCPRAVCCMCSGCVCVRACVFVAPSGGSMPCHAHPNDASTHTHTHTHEHHSSTTRHSQYDPPGQPVYCTPPSSACLGLPAIRSLFASMQRITRVTLPLIVWARSVRYYRLEPEHIFTRMRSTHTQHSMQHTHTRTHAHTHQRNSIHTHAHRLLRRRPKA